MTGTAVTYCRVSTAEQANHGYSMAQQRDALRAHAERQGWTVVAEFADPGASGGSLVRPGLDALRNRVEAGDVDAVLVQDLDRASREVVGVLVLQEEFRRNGCALVALNDPGDDSPSGQMLRTIRAAVGEYEKTLITERSRRGRQEKVKQGKLLGATPRARYGFQFTADRTSFAVDPEKMATVRRILSMLAEGGSVHSVQRELEQGGVPAPLGGRKWSRATIRGIALDDVYRPHTAEEVAEVVTAEVAANLACDELYGLSWWNLRKTEYAPAGDRANGHQVRRTAEVRDRSEQTAVPIPLAGSGISRSIVDAARANVEGNRTVSAAGDRVWPLSGGVLVCQHCGRRMAPYRRRYRNGEGFRNYYRCTTRTGIEDCENRLSHPAEVLEAKVWNLVGKVLRDPRRLWAAFDALIQREREAMMGADPERDERAWAQKLAELDATRARMQDLAVEGLLSADELRDRLARSEEQRKTAQKELEAARSRGKRIADLKRDRLGVFFYWQRLERAGIMGACGGKQHRLYKRMGLRLEINASGDLRATGNLLPGLSEEDEEDGGALQTVSTSSLTAPRARGRRCSRGGCRVSCRRSPTRRASRSRRWRVRPGWGTVISYAGVLFAPRTTPSRPRGWREGGAIPVLERPRWPITGSCFSTSSPSSAVRRSRY